MDVAKWDDSFKTGHKVVDTQHEELFRMVNELHAAILAERGKEALIPTLHKLAAYTNVHFRSEEELMTQTQYPAMAAHKAKHDQLTQEVKDLLEKYQAGRVVLTMTLSNFLAKWLRHHIKEDDVALVKFLRAHGSGKAASSAKA